MSTEAKQTRRTPDGAPIRAHYTDSAWADDTLAVLITLFTFFVDDRDPASHRFALWFLRELSPLLVEARGRFPFARMYVARRAPSTPAHRSCQPDALRTRDAVLDQRRNRAPAVLRVVAAHRGDAVGRARALLLAVSTGFLVVAHRIAASSRHDVQYPTSLICVATEVQTSLV